MSVELHACRYVVVVREQTSVEFSGVGGPRSWSAGSVQGQTSSIPVGALLVNIYDPANEQLIWRGDADNACFCTVPGEQVSTPRIFKPPFCPNRAC